MLFSVRLNDTVKKIERVFFIQDIAYKELIFTFVGNLNLTENKCLIP
jgi:hypothetical protein